MDLFTNIFHISLFCNDINRTMKFYTALGAQVAFGVHEPGNDEDWNLYLRIAPKQYIEIQPVKAPNPHPHPDSAKYYDNQTLWHFSLETDDLGMVIDHLRSQGLRMTQLAEPDSKEVLSLNDAIYSVDGCFICWVRDPDGTPIELMERTKHSMQTRAEKRISGNFLP